MKLTVETGGIDPDVVVPLGLIGTGTGTGTLPLLICIKNKLVYKI